MIFFTLHHLFHALFADIMTYIQINCLTALIGAICYFLTYGYMVEYANGFSRIIKDWWWYICVADISVMAVIYRNYYGRTIIAEVGVDTEDDHWDYNEEKHRYRKKQRLSRSRTTPEITHEPIDDSDPLFDRTREIQEKIDEAVKKGIYAAQQSHQPEEIKDRIKNSLHLYVPDDTEQAEFPSKVQKKDTHQDIQQDQNQQDQNQQDQNQQDQNQQDQNQQDQNQQDTIVSTD